MRYFPTRQVRLPWLWGRARKGYIKQGAFHDVFETSRVAILFTSTHSAFLLQHRCVKTRVIYSTHLTHIHSPPDELQQQDEEVLWSHGHEAQRGDRRCSRH
jgi:hypothetical protein